MEMKTAKAKIQMTVDGNTVNGNMSGNIKGMIAAMTALVMHTVEELKQPEASMEECVEALLCAIEENVIGNLKEKEETPSVQRVALASSLGDGAKEDAPGGAGV